MEFINIHNVKPNTHQLIRFDELDLHQNPPSRLGGAEDLVCVAKFPVKLEIFKSTERSEAESVKVGQNLLGWHLSEAADLRSGKGFY